MRQAGRYLPEYRSVRRGVSFTDLCRSPELILKVVKQPLERFDLDAAILFSDILTMLEPMGMQFDFSNGGPKLKHPITTPEDVDRLKECDVEKDLSFVFDGIRLIKQSMPGKPLIGFIGSPITLACYLIEGGGSKTFNAAKRFLHMHKSASTKLLDKITDVASQYLRAQVEAGCDAVKIFDSWGGILSQDDYRQWSIPYLNRILDNVKGTGVPRILFVNNVAPYLKLLRDVDCEVIGVDYRMDLNAAQEMIPDKAIQGNFDPSALFGPPELVEQRTRRLLEGINDPRRFIFNLGHGVQPDTPIESIQALINTVRKFGS